MVCQQGKVVVGGAGLKDMIFRVGQTLGKGSKRPLSHISPKPFAALTAYRQIFFSSSQSHHKWTNHRRQLQSMPLGDGIPSKGCRCAGVTKSYILTNVICPNVHIASNPCIYSDGRWLSWDKLERESRYIEFDFTALCKTALKLCPGALSIASYEKKEGGYNKVFIFTMDNASRIVARLPTRISGPPRLTTNSEVATIEYCESRASSNDSIAANLIAYQCNPEQESPYPKFSSGAMTLRMLSGASIYSWNMPKVFNCIRYGRQCPWSSGLLVLEPLLKI